MYKNTDELKEAIKTHKLENFEKEILNLAKPSIQILREKVDEDSIPIGASKLGGNPDLPEDFEWQSYEEKPLTFIGQFNLSELHPYDKENLLPDTGILYFFYAVDSIIWGAAEHKGGWQIYYLEDENAPLTRRQHPQAEGEYTKIDKLPVNQVKYETAITLPRIYRNEFKEKGLNITTKDEREAYWRLFWQESNQPLHYFFGDPTPVQGDVLWEAVEGSQNIKPDFDTHHKRNENQIEHIKSERDNWLFLFQVDTDDDLDVMWGDAGMLYICIPKKDLQDRNFDACWTIMQCY